METISSSSKIGEKTSDDDRFSNLPKDILHHIFCNIHIKQVIQTCALSKAWRYFWTSFPSLSFIYEDKYCFGHGEFHKFVNKVLHGRRKSPIHTLEVIDYSSRQMYFTRYIKLWIRVAVQCNVHQLTLQFDFNGGRLYVPPTLFKCKSLTSLSLLLSDKNPLSDVLLVLPKVIDMPVLKTLRLRSISSISTKFLDKIFLGCPILKKLEIFFCEFDDYLDPIVISATQLKHLGFYGCLPGKYTDRFQITISCPNLTSFTCNDWAFYDYYLDKLPWLESAELDMDGIDDYYDQDDKDNCTEDVVRFLEGLYGVKYLTLHSHVLEVLHIFLLSYILSERNS
ncbi:hypothetical protein AQUCO_02800133v1 [Aquilegia coerulea]|uniref:Uncharacterized protein n=1 Tax=Aquilegia coerulea TaxID=218851 RepID=A0A2G5D407_AQUCA|nr:hypothetical protein AQUCO_02800133v1 [Aquilegia coerulea]